MKNARAAVIGLGSMGSRRIRLLKQYFPDITVLGVDLSGDRRRKAEETFGIEVYASLDEAFESTCGYAFVCTSPLSHSKIITQCLTEELHTFSELNLVSEGYEENIALAGQKGITLFMSSTFLYRDDVRYIIDAANKENMPLFYSYHIGQYLPDWHPWESYKDFFVADKRTGGCRELLAFELPWLSKAFGAITKTASVNRTVSSLKLPYPDTYLIQLEHENGNAGQLIIDVVTRVPVRHMEVFGENIQLEWRGKPEELREAAPGFSQMQKVDLNSIPQRQEGYRDFIVEDAYREEMKAFFEVAAGKRKPVYTFKDDLDILKITDGIMGEGF